MTSAFPPNRTVPSAHHAPPPLLGVDRAGERAGTPVSFIRRLVAARRIRFCRVGRYVEFSLDALEEFIAAGWVEPRTSRGPRDWRRWR
jgi:excisionase family DNA binding protein